MKNALIIDDSADSREIVQAILSAEVQDVQVAGSIKEAFSILEVEEFDLIVCDLHMPFALDHDVVNYPYSYEVGIRTIKELEQVFPSTPIIAMTATVPWEIPQVMKELPHIPTLSKPFAADALLSLVRSMSDKSTWQ